MNILQEKLIDTHCHLDDKRYDDNFPEIIEEIKKEMLFIINPSTNFTSMAHAIKLGKFYPFIRPAIGIHPEECKDIDIKTLEHTFNKLFDIVKIMGEIGLDYYNIFCPKKKQLEFLEFQLEYAKKVQVPVILHSRNAFDDTYELVKKVGWKRVIWHCFSYGIEEAKKVLDLENFISFTGVITFKKAENTREVVKYVPIERMCAETDGPYLTPHPFRGKLNRPIYVRYVIEKIAELKNKSFSEINLILNQNAQKFFNQKI